jgi:hypothetical protein
MEIIVRDDPVPADIFPDQGIGDKTGAAGNENCFIFDHGH